MEGADGAECLSTLHKMWFGFHAQELYSKKSKLHGRKLIAFVDKFRNWDFVFGELLSATALQMYFTCTLRKMSDRCYSGEGVH